MNADPKVIAWALKVLLICLAVIGILFLIFTGKLTIYSGLLVAFLPIIIPYLKRKQSTTEEQSTMTQVEALEILGLHPGATKEDIIKAHRRIVSKTHPDAGGSDYLAKKVNLAKDVLLKDL